MRVSGLNAVASTAALLGTLIVAAPLRGEESDDPAKLIESYAALDLDEKAKGERPHVAFDDTSKNRIWLEHRLVACGKAAVKPLVAALAGNNRHVQAMAAELLGVIGDKAAVPALLDAARASDTTTRIYALQSLAWLQSGKDVIDEATKDSNANVAFVAKRAREQLAAKPRVREALRPRTRRGPDAALREEQAGGLHAALGRFRPRWRAPRRGKAALRARGVGERPRRVRHRGRRGTMEVRRPLLERSPLDGDHPGRGAEGLPVAWRARDPASRSVSSPARGASPPPP